MAVVHIVNPSKRRKSKMATPRRDSKGRFIKGSKGSRRRRRRRNPETTAVARRTSNAPARRSSRRRRRRNPEEAGSAISFRAVWPGIVPSLLGRLWTAFAVRRWGGPWGTSVFGTPGVPPSPYAGQQWSFQGYFVGLLAAWVGAKAVSRWRGARFGFHFWRGAVENMAMRAVWTEGIARSAWGQETFGTAFQDDRTGTRWLQTPTGYQSMMGLQAARPLDDYIVQARPLDGLQPARPVDMKSRGVGGRRWAPMGHYLPPGTPDTSARYHGSGSNTSYHSAYQQAY